MGKEREEEEEEGGEEEEEEAKQSSLSVSTMQLGLIEFPSTKQRRKVKDLRKKKY